MNGDDEGQGLFIELVFFVINTAISTTIVAALISVGWIILWRNFLSKYQLLRVLLGMNGQSQTKQSKRSESSSSNSGKHGNLKQEKEIEQTMDMDNKSASQLMTAANEHRSDINGETDGFQNPETKQAQKDKSE